MTEYMLFSKKKGVSLDIEDQIEIKKYLSLTSFQTDCLFSRLKR